MEYPAWQRYDTVGESPTMGKPWEWDISDRILDQVRTLSKTRRKAKVCEVGWNIYSVVQGVVRSQPITKENQAMSVGGLVLDYDASYNETYLMEQIRKLSREVWPQYIERSLGGNVRLVWLFHDWLPVVNDAHCAAFWRVFCKPLKVERLHPGLDEASWNPAQRWTNGVIWQKCSEFEVVPKATTISALIVAGREYKMSESGDVPLSIVHEEVEKRWPGRWQGEFEVGAKGVRFWEDGADNPNGCLIKPDGVVCVTGGKAWVPWEEMFGKEWVQKHREKRLDDAMSNIHFDGRDYWHMSPHGWVNNNRTDTMLELTKRGFSDRVAKGESISQAGLILRNIQTINRVDFAVPMVNYRPGIVTLESTRFLNTNRVEALQPAEDGDPSLWPFLHKFIHGFFARPEDRPLDYFLAWLQRAYRALLNYRPAMGQAIFICGPRDSGKTLMILRVLKPLLGGKEGDPYAYLTGKTDFNSDLFESYLWALNDSDEPKEGAKGTVLAKIKGAVVNPTHAYHKKFGAKTILRWTGRIAVSLNDDPGSVGMLPENNSNTLDKMMFFAAQSFEGSFPESEELEATIERELPHFARWLLDWKAPAEVRDNTRMGVKSYYDSQVLAVSRQQHYAYNFKEILQTWVNTGWDDGQKEFTGTPTDILADMHNNPMVAPLVREFKTYMAAKALTTLSREPGSGVVYKSEAGRIFQITKQDLLSA